MTIQSPNKKLYTTEVQMKYSYSTVHHIEIKA